jgi:methylated-DNA-[protein]-cysteine S-methyltransferase
MSSTKKSATENPDQSRCACFSTVSSPVGKLMLVADDSALTGLYFLECDHTPPDTRRWRHDPDHPLLRQTETELREYFDGSRQRFSLAVRPSGTQFQESVWREIARIPYGETISYSELASRAGAPQAVRAAGTSTGRNPVSIVIPCHRVMGKNGSMCGFGGGLDRKRFLLELEGMKFGAAEKTTAQTCLLL